MLFGPDLQARTIFSQSYTTLGADVAVFGGVLAGAAATLGAGASVIGNVLAVGAITVGAGGSVGSQTTLSTSPVDPMALMTSLEATRTSFASQGSAAQTSLSNMGTGTLLDSSITTNMTLFSGVYSAAGLTTAASTILTLDGQGLNDQFWVFNIGDYLVTGASTRIELRNPGLNNSVIWNTGAYSALGADSTFLGTLLTKDYISVGTNVDLIGVGSTCGGIFSTTSYVVLGANSTVGGRGCSGIGDGFRIGDDGEAFQATTALPTNAVPEPATWAVMTIGFGLVGAMLRRRRMTCIGGVSRTATGLQFGAMSPSLTWP